MWQLAPQDPEFVYATNVSTVERAGEATPPAYPLLCAYIDNSWQKISGGSALSVARCVENLRQQSEAQHPVFIYTLTMSDDEAPTLVAAEGSEKPTKALGMRKNGLCSILPI